MKIKPLITGVLCLAAAFATAKAQTFQYLGSPTGEQYGGYYVGAYSSTLGGTPMSSWCVDGLDTIYQNDTWTVDKVSLTTLPSINTSINVGYPSLTLQDFQAMFILGSQFTGNATTDGQLDQAIWNFSDPTGFGLNSTEQLLQNAALADVGNYNYSNAYVLVPTSDILTGPNPGNAPQVFETGTLSLASSAPGAPAPPMAACLAFAGVLILQAFRNRKTVKVTV